jgi:PKD repeat protein
MTLKSNKLFTTTFLTILILILTIAGIPHFTQGTFKTTSPDPTITITANTDKQTYLLRQKITISGTIIQDGTPATDLVVIMQITNPLNVTFAYRTLTIGNPTQTWPINITNIFLLDSTNQPINTAKIGATIQIGVTVYNPQLTPRETYVTITVFDANMVPLRATSSSGTVDPQSYDTSRFSVYIPKWACSGKALICANVYSKEPNQGGLALTEEKTAYFCISKTQTALLEYPELPPPPPQNTPGQYQTQITTPPEPTAGTYQTYISAQASPIIRASNSTTFTIQNSQGYPPQASFAYWPATPYENQTIQFDASSSTPEGFNDTITSYTWDFGDGTTPTTETDPYITHKYLNADTYVITLNVTDNEGLWSTTQKPIIIYPEFGPTANFTWTPQTPIINQTVTFNASSSTPGWSKTRGDYSPITNYNWNFSDGTIIDTPNPVITHNYTEPGNYTVTLTITDANGRTAQAQATIQVLNVTLKLFDVNNDGQIDLIDVFRVALAYGSYPGHPKWDPVCDFNKDNSVDLIDYFLVCMHYGEDP